MRLAIVGSRSVLPELYPDILPYIPEHITEIVSGGAKGADELAERYAAEHHLPLHIIRPEYEKYRRNAGLMRNRTIIQQADFALILWDGASHGSANLIKLCVEEYTQMRVLLVRDGKLVKTLFGQEEQGNLL